MAWRTSPEEVKSALGPNYDTDSAPSLDVFIETAKVLVDEVSTCATAKSATMATALLVKIECWLAAHFYAHSDQLYSEKKTENASAKFQGETAMHLQSTQYGQTAMTLDISGCLASFNSGVVRAQAIWLGRVPSDQTAIWDRD